MLEYDVLNVLKGAFVSSFYVDATDECPPVEEILALAQKVHGIAAYAYLGDVGQSVTGDKRAQPFEDDILPEFLAYCKELGFQAVASMPTRNTAEQASRVQALCKELELFQICGEDINQPRQSFVCKQLGEPAFAHLIDATWAMIAHENEATMDPARGMFSMQTIAKQPELQQRILAFAAVGREKYAGKN
jgi:hypothetical protein